MVGQWAFGESAFSQRAFPGGIRNLFMKNSAAFSSPADPSPVPMKEPPPDGPENPDVPVREPDPEEPNQI